MEVSGSILAVKSNFFDYARMLKYANVDCLHIDIFQAGSEFTIDDLLKFDGSYLPLDVHLIFEEISDVDIDILNRANVKYLNVQYETLINKDCIFELSRKFKGNFGVAITTKTSIDVVDRYIDYISQVMFMCSEPGVSGAKFDEGNFERIKKVKSLYPTLKLCADGGINNVIGEKMGKMGVSLIVSGSYLGRNFEQLDVNSYKLKYLNERDVNVKRKMLKINLLPLIDEEASFEEVINIMNRFRLGVVFVVKGDDLQGIVTDGDVRRGFITYGKNIFCQKAKELMNVNPVVVESNQTVEDVYKLLLSTHKGIDIVPVLEDKKLIGAIDMHIGL